MTAYSIKQASNNMLHDSCSYYLSAFPLKWNLLQPRGAAERPQWLCYMQDKTYDTGDDPDLRLTCAKVHYSHCRDKGHIDFCYKLDRTAPAYMECQV